MYKRQVYRHPRSLTDRQIDCIITRGGLIGINLYRAFLGRPGSAGFAAAHRHIRHVLERGGEHVLALGSDFDGIGGQHELETAADMPLLAEALRREGFTEDEVEAIYWRNAYRFFKNNL